MRKIKDPKDYQEIRKLRHGFVYNDFSPSGNQPDDNILHKASCHWLEISNLNVDKFFFNDLYEAEAWLEANRPEAWRKCRTCLVSEG